MINMINMSSFVSEVVLSKNQLSGLLLTGLRQFLVSLFKNSEFEGAEKEINSEVK